MSEIRYDTLHDTHVIIAPERLHRPQSMDTIEQVSAQELCPFCEGNEAMTPPEIFALRKSGTFANEQGWMTRVVPNLYKAVQIEAPYQHHYGMFEYWEGFGAHEIVIDSPLHHTSMTQWSKEEITLWLQTIKERIGDLRRDHRITYLSIFKNEGKSAGSTQNHSHTQIIGLPLIPKEHQRRFLREYEYYKNSGKALLESILIQEDNVGARMIAKKGSFSAFCPYASAYPFEVMISSCEALGSIDMLDEKSMDECSALILSILARMRRQLGIFHFNLCIDTPPLQEESVGYDAFMSVHKYHRFAIRIMPRIYQHGGFEVGNAMMINPVAPERAAKLLREYSYE